MLPLNEEINSPHRPRDGRSMSDCAEVLRSSLSKNATGGLKTKHPSIA
ncbi:hypothetical protein RSSM_06430 [Rhodopirellula sallentina SM41]|uniref:Uncharacterized protein n=1 Tax=Rhodopirellula sallentina SM41 TaxID=1263870 RepID=M5TSU9_9BACT|nr:hypothetical protein RSSM_06430 [Rhodopirellula sallentina SM41]